MTLSHLTMGFRLRLGRGLGYDYTSPDDGSFEGAKQLLQTVTRSFGIYVPHRTPGSYSVQSHQCFGRNLGARYGSQGLSHCGCLIDIYGMEA